MKTIILSLAWRLYNEDREQLLGPNLLQDILVCLWSILREFLKGEKIKPWVWFKFIDNIFFIWFGLEEELDSFFGLF